MSRERYHPVPIGTDLLRGNNFEFVAGSNDQIKLMCKSVTVTTPKTNPVAVPWSSGTMSLAGRLSGAFTFTLICLVGLESQFNAWENLYEWRKRVFDHDSGRIAVASEYKEDASILIYDITNDNIKATVKMNGVWPSEVSDLTFSVESDAVVEVSATMQADKIQIESFG